jgi:hypothetical protein
MTTRSGLVAGWLVVLAGAATAHADAIVPFAGGGYDNYSGPGGQVTRSGMVLAGATQGRTLAALTFARFDDNHVGQGSSYTAMVGVPATPVADVRVWGSRLVGDRSFDAWRLKAGPRLAAISGASMGLYYLHYADHAGSRSDGASLEAEIPFRPWLSAHASAGIANAPDGAHAEQGMVGAGWRPVHGLELSGDVGLARNGTLMFTPGPPSRTPLLDPLLGGGGSGGTTSNGSKTEGIVQLGVRLIIP